MSSLPQALFGVLAKILPITLQRLNRQPHLLLSCILITLGNYQHVVMNGHSWTPFFQLPLDDDPINTMQKFGNPLDQTVYQTFNQTYDWAEAQWAPIDAWHQYHVQHNSNFVVDGTVSPGRQESQAFCIAPEPLEPLQVAETNVAEKFPDVLSEDYLLTLAPKQLEEFQKKATKLLEKSHKKSHNTAIPCPQQPHLRPTRRSNSSERVQKDSITCEHPGCRTTFSRKKDQLRHFRIKHGNHQSFRCPIVSCRMGEGHEFSRSDKLRDHLSSKSLQSATWLCILPGCSEARVGKEGILDHLGTHELYTRTQEQETIRAYGFLNIRSPYERGYLELKNICPIYGCSFGTDSDDVMKSHLSIPHEGSRCPCPITSCKQNFGDRNAVSEHLSRDHDALTRRDSKKKLSDQGFWWGKAVFICPICKFEIRKENHPRIGEDNKCRKHVRTHNLEERVQNFQALVHAFVFSFGYQISVHYGWKEDVGDEAVFKFMTGQSLEDHLACLKRRALSQHI